MLYLNGLIGCIFLLIALLHAAYPMPFAWVPYLGAAVLAFITLKGEISHAFARALAVLTTITMFFFFAGFFVVVPKLAADWYSQQDGWHAVCRLLGAFAMIPIMSEYSCRCKAECLEARAHRRRAFFSVPRHIPDHR